MRRSVALLLCALLATPACASSRGGARLQLNQQMVPQTDQTLLVNYVKALPIGSRVRVTLIDDDRIRGTLMNVTDDAIVIQESTRVPEPPRRLAMSSIRTVEPDRPGSGARAIAIGAAVGAGAALGLLMLIAALAYD